jgi:hypothetical protein
MHQAKSKKTELMTVRANKINPKDPKLYANVISLYPISVNFGLIDYYHSKGSEGKKVFKTVPMSEPNKSKLDNLFKKSITCLLFSG